jgi:hypothetical protein
MKTTTLVAVLLSAGALLSGYVSSNCQAAPRGTPPLVPVNLATVQPPVVMVLDTIITYGGPGSWKREALWDEYVVTISNQGTQPLTIASAALTDFAGTSHAPGAGMQALERRSTTLEQKYLNAGVPFARDAGPAAVTVGGGVRLVGAVGGVTGAGAGLAAVAAVVPVPVYYVRKIVSLKEDVKKDGTVAEFKQRRLALPLTLAPGEARVGSLFFPMVPRPRALSLHWSSGASGAELTLPLESVHGLHVQAPAPAVTPPRP